MFKPPINNEIRSDSESFKATELTILKTLQKYNFPVLTDLQPMADTERYIILSDAFTELGDLYSAISNPSLQNLNDANIFYQHSLYLNRDRKPYFIDNGGII